MRQSSFFIHTIYHTIIVNIIHVCRYHEITNEMNKIYSTAKVPSIENPKKLLSLEPELTEIFAQSRNHSELQYYWDEWRKASGGKMRDFFIKNIALTNEAARLFIDRCPLFILGMVKFCAKTQCDQIERFLKALGDKF